jgi:homoserine dehydrogenase
MEKGADFDPTLAIAQKKGYAEPDPSFDIDGIDAAHKIGILSYIAHGTSLPPQNFYIEGISDITSSDFKNASDLGYVIKHLAVANQINDSIELRAHPALIRKESILASLQGVRNGIEIDTDLVGKIHITGSGAGQESTASGLISDIIHLSNNNIAITDNIAQESSSESLKEFNEILFKHYFSMEIEDEKEINQKIISEADNNNIKIEQIISNKDKPSNIYFITNLVKESEASNLLNQLKAIGSVKNIKRIRIESE